MFFYSETDGDSARETEEVLACPKCGLPEELWTWNHGLGCKKAYQTYCCRGCADNTRCVCVE